MEFSNSSFCCSDVYEIFEYQDFLSVVRRVRRRRRPLSVRPSRPSVAVVRRRRPLSVRPSRPSVRRRPLPANPRPHANFQKEKPSKYMSGV